ncbi:hypothetical protein POM88_049587 [Heracleum sosnowskyi]|uniref:Uncharacterized protein n=1 Tax=Heracleum sosnowskyi TaxID=360622 RepID=A0AAD8GX43_9APIA|nr:hypothetical protein POM88_049587 [Heracleum sosnowskyi]
MDNSGLKRRAGFDRHHSVNVVNNNVNLNPRVLNFNQHSFQKSFVTNKNQDPNIITPTSGSTDASVRHRKFSTNDKRISIQGTTFQSPLSRLMKSNPVVNNRQSNFQLPASVITPRKGQDDLIMKERLLDSFNRDRGVHINANCKAEHSKTQIDSRILETSASTKRKENQRFITVTVPDPKQLGLNCPGSSSGAKNLLSAFNDVDDDEDVHNDNVNDILNPENQVYEAVVSDEEVDDDAAHRGHYVLDDEVDKENEIPGIEVLKSYDN